MDADVKRLPVLSRHLPEWIFDDGRGVYSSFPTGIDSHRFWLYAPLSNSLMAFDHLQLGTGEIRYCGSWN